MSLSNLPPGVTDADIEWAAGWRPKRRRAQKRADQAMDRSEDLREEHRAGMHDDGRREGCGICDGESW